MIAKLIKLLHLFIFLNSAKNLVFLLKIENIQTFIEKTLVFEKII